MFEPKSGGQMIKSNQKENNVVRTFFLSVGPGPPPLTKIPGSAHVCYIYVLFWLGQCLFSCPLRKDT